MTGFEYIPISQHQVTNFIDEKAQIEAAARELFSAYTKALPDEYDWHGDYGWRFGRTGKNEERLQITIDGEGIEYQTEYCSDGERESHYLNLPLSALYDPNFLTDEQARWAAAKEHKAALILQEEEIAKEKGLESDRKMYERLMKHFDPEIYERMKQTENQS